MGNLKRNTIHAIGCLALGVWNTGHADDKRWDFLFTNAAGTQFFYDKQIFNSDRESVGTWIRFSNEDGGHTMWGLRVTCTGHVMVFNERIYAKDGRLLKGTDGPPVEVVVVPGTGVEGLRNELCKKRPAWQRVLGK